MTDRKAGKQGYSGIGWYYVLISALTGCFIAAGFPQFSMTITGLSAVSGISPAVLLTSDTVKSAALVLGMLIAGFTYNRFGATKAVIFSLLASIIPQLLMPHVNSVLMLMTLKFIQGIPSGILTPVFLTIIFKNIPERNAGLSTAVFNSIFYAGAGLGGIIAGIVIASYDWVASFYALGAIQTILGATWLLTVRDTVIPQAAGGAGGSGSAGSSGGAGGGSGSAGSTGGVGSAAVQIAAAVGARVVAVASLANHDYLLSLGASEVFDYHAADWAQQVRAAVPGGVDLLFDGAGGQTRDQALDAVRDGGRAISIVLQGAPLEVGRGITDESFAAHGGRTRLEQLAALVDAGKLRPQAGTVLPLDQAREALARVAARHTRGKIVLQVG